MQSATNRSSDASLTALIIGVVIALWSASGGMAALETGLDIAYDVPVDRKFAAKRLIAMPLMLATVLLGGIAGGADGVRRADRLGHRVPCPDRRHRLRRRLDGRSAGWSRSSRSRCCSRLLLPRPEPPLPQLAVGQPRRHRRLGDLHGRVGRLLVLRGQVRHYGKTYGAFAGVAILIFWLYLVGLAILFGGEINAETEREAAAEPATLARKPARPT